MSAATQFIPRIYKALQNLVTNNHPIAASTKIYGGTAVGDNGSGFARPLQAADPFLGFADADYDNTNGAAGDLRVNCNHAVQVQLDITGASASSVGKKVYASDDQTFTLTASSNSLIGVVRQHVSGTKCLVELQPYVES
jgi:hypothetical protein